MRLPWKKKSMWERAVEPLANHVDGQALTRSGLAAVAGAVSLTAASALLSSWRRRENG